MKTQPKPRPNTLAIKGVVGNAGFRGTFKQTAKALGLTVDIVQRIADARWKVFPRK